MTKILIHEATVKLAMKAFKECHYYMLDAGLPNQSLLNQAFTAHKSLAEALAEQPAQQEPVGRTDRQIVDQTEELAVWLLSWGFSRQPETLTPMRETRHPMAERCWSAACHIQEMLTATDPENSVAELDDAPQAQPAREPLTDEQIDKAAMKLAECMDYPWAQMPEQGKRSMRSHAKAVIDASGITKGNT